MTKYCEGDYCVAIQVDHTGPLVVVKEQLVKIMSVYCEKGQFIYFYYYGLEGYHEGFTQENRLRFLTDKESELLDNKKYLDLPRDFYDRSVIL